VAAKKNFSHFDEWVFFLINRSIESAPGLQLKKKNRNIPGERLYLRFHCKKDWSAQKQIYVWLYMLQCTNRFFLPRIGTVSML
jgi:hypothetical protein